MKKQLIVPSGSLYNKTMELLENCGMDVFDIAVATGLPYYWLRVMAQKRIKDPSVNRTQILYEYLANRTLEV